MSSSICLLAWTNHLCFSSLAECRRLNSSNRFNYEMSAYEKSSDFLSWFFHWIFRRFSWPKLRGFHRIFNLQNTWKTTKNSHENPLTVDFSLLNHATLQSLSRNWVLHYEVVNYVANLTIKLRTSKLNSQLCPNRTSHG